ncbi:glutathione S-transferase family protein [Methylobacterium sp. W2]|uniref:glutathione S-transferase family protein n=1 Tax=Methylobacterium sp. W2 TaxID=2598107 RepID=UPI001D0BFF12|nr:glutathione S-transferase family protein [Methylobacterium sp. W2]MCC0807985.1 glutathione S-transferase family protein [Methylobacterium sp. W2]
MTSEITLYHSPNTRSSGVRILLEELQAPYRLHVLNMRAGEQREAAYLAINPLGKVPAIRHGDAVITEQPAIYLYLADEFAEKGLAPPIGDPLRGPYLRWMILYGSCFEPAVIDRALEREPGPMAMSPYGSFDSVLDSLVAGLATGPYLLGERFSAADILWGAALAWMTAFKLVPEEPVIVAYVARIKDRPAFRKMQAEEAALADRQQEAV